MFSLVSLAAAGCRKLAMQLRTPVDMATRTPDPVDMGSRTPVILITDIGSDPDDIIALLVLMASDSLHLLAIITTGGDTVNRARVVSRWLDLSGCPTRPPILPDMSTDRPDSLCCVPPGTPALQEADISSLRAEEALVAAAREHGGALGVIAIGQLTALAGAVRVSPAALRGIGFLAIQGQLQEEGGRILPDLSAFNLRQDAIAAREVFEQLQDYVPFRLLGKHAAMAVPLYRENLSMVPNIEQDIEQSLGQFKKENPEVFHRCYTEGQPREGDSWLTSLCHLVTPYDPLLVLSLLHPQLFRQVNHSRGHTSIGNTPGDPGVQDSDKVRQLLTDCLGKLFI